MTRMDAVVATAPGQYGLQQVDVPKPQGDEVLCRVRAVALCGSDPGLLAGAQAGRGWPPAYPFVFGHEWAGEVVENGPLASRFLPGTRVAGEAHCGCGACQSCRAGQYNLCLNYGDSATGHRHYGFSSAGAFAQYGVFRQSSLTSIPNGVSYDQATLCDAAGVALHGLRSVRLAPPCTVAVYGPGPIGCLAMQIAKASGARTIMVGRGRRLAAAGALGADALVDYEREQNPPAAIEKHTGGLGADVVVECSGTERGLGWAIQSARRDGAVVLLAFYKPDAPAIPVNAIHLRQLHLHGSRANPNCAAAVMRLILEGKIDADAFLTHSFPLRDIRKAVETFTSRDSGAIKVVLHPFE